VPGLSDGLEEPGSLQTHLLDGNEHITVLTAGHPVSDPAGLVGGWITTAVFPLFSRSDLVVLDTPATASHPDALALAPLCDATLLVVDPRTSRRRSCLRLLEQLRGVGANPVGVVINRSTTETWSTARRWGRRPAGPSSNTGWVPDVVAPPTPAVNGSTPSRSTVVVVTGATDSNGSSSNASSSNASSSNGSSSNASSSNGSRSNGNRRLPTNGRPPAEAEATNGVHHDRAGDGAAGTSG
jgi:hypothetical protein